VIVNPLFSSPGAMRIFGSVMCPWAETDERKKRAMTVKANRVLEDIVDEYGMVLVIEVRIKDGEIIQ